MNMIYNSASFCVVEFAPLETADDEAADDAVGGYEIMDKVARRGIFIDGQAARAFRDHVAAMIQEEPSMDDIDEFLDGFSPMMLQPVVLH
ncbi:DUF3567 domain-containing protein [soil metagenome]